MECEIRGMIPSELAPDSTDESRSPGRNESRSGERSFNNGVPSWIGGVDPSLDLGNHRSFQCEQGFHTDKAASEFLTLASTKLMHRHKI